MKIFKARNWYPKNDCRFEAQKYKPTIKVENTKESFDLIRKFILGKKKKSTKLNILLPIVTPWENSSHSTLNNYLLNTYIT